MNPGWFKGVAGSDIPPISTRMLAGKEPGCRPHTYPRPSLRARLPHPLQLCRMEGRILPSPCDAGAAARGHLRAVATPAGGVRRCKAASSDVPPAGAGLC